jgi:hypothetical protein
MFGLVPETIVLTVLGVVVCLAQMIDLEAYYWTPFAEPARFGLWHFKQDEGLIVHDARLYAGHGAPGARFDDFEPPNSAVFGVGSHLLAAAGMRLLGPNRTGLRWTALLAATAAQVLLSFIVLRTAPGVIGFALAVALLLDYAALSLARLAIVEHYLHAMVLGILAFYVAAPGPFIAHLRLLAVLSSALVLFKPNFPWFAYLVLVSTVAAERLGWSVFGAVTGWFLAGTVAFELLQVAFLGRHGVARRRYGVIETAIREFSGIQKTPVRTTFFPAGLDIAGDFATMAVEHWAAPFGLGLAATAAFRRGLGVLLAGGGVAVCWMAVTGDGPAYVVAMVLTLAGTLAACAPFAFSFKRALFPLHVLTLVLAALGARALTVRTLGGGGQWVVAGVIAAAWAWRQASFMKRAPRVRRAAAPSEARSLEAAVPPASTVYAHCYASRCFWPCRGIRFISADDNARTNQDTIDLAVAERGEFVLLSSRGGPVTRVGLEGDAELGLVGRYRSTEPESDEDDIYLLMAVRRTAATGRARTARGLPSALAECGIDGTVRPDADGCLTALAARPRSPTAVRRAYLAASRLSALGATASARRVFAVLERSGFNPAGVRYHLGRIALAEGLAEDARRWLLGCLSYSPRHRAASELLATMRAARVQAVGAQRARP